MGVPVRLDSSSHISRMPQYWYCIHCLFIYSVKLEDGGNWTSRISVPLIYKFLSFSWRLYFHGTPLAVDEDFHLLQ
jgi:hypothetical protein